MVRGVTYRRFADPDHPTHPVLTRFGQLSNSSYTLSL